MSCIPKARRREATKATDAAETLPPWSRCRSSASSTAPWVCGRPPGTPTTIPIHGGQARRPCMGQSSVPDCCCRLFGSRKAGRRALRRLQASAGAAILPPPVPPYSVLRVFKMLVLPSGASLMAASSPPHPHPTPSSCDAAAGQRGSSSKGARLLHCRRTPEALRSSGRLRAGEESPSGLSRQGGTGSPRCRQGSPHCKGSSSSRHLRLRARLLCGLGTPTSP